MHFLLLGAHITQVIWIRSYLYWNILYNFYAKTLQANSFDRVVGHQAELVCAQLLQYLCPYSIIALIRLEAQMHIGFNGVIALFLELVPLDSYRR